MKMLFITSQLPYPPHSGGVIKSWKLVEFFAKQYELTVTCPLKLEDDDNTEAFKHAVPKVVLWSYKVNRSRSLKNWLKSLLQGKTLNEFRSYNDDLAKRIEQTIKEFDLVFIDHYEVFQYCSNVYQGPLILHTHNAEGQIWKRYASIANGFLKRLFISAESGRIEKAERKYVENADLVFAAPNDIQFLRGSQKSDKFKPTYHLGNDSMLSLPQLVFSETSVSLLYVGTLTWEANVEGLLWFRETVWPKLKSQFPDVAFHIIGKNPDQRIEEWARVDDNLKLHGFVEDLEPFYTKCRVMVAPLRFGSGMKVKILDAFYRGIPVVTTSIGVESLEIENGKHLLFSDDPHEVLKYVVKMLNDSESWNHISHASRELASRQYQWNNHLNQIQSQIIELCQHSSQKIK